MSISIVNPSGNIELISAGGVRNSSADIKQYQRVPEALQLNKLTAQELIKVQKPNSEL